MRYIEGFLCFCFYFYLNFLLVTEILQQITDSEFRSSFDCYRTELSECKTVVFFCVHMQ